MVAMDILTNVTYKTQNAIYAIPNNMTKVNSTASKCDKTEELLSVYWDNGNSFDMKFRLTNESYDLSSINLTLNGSTVFNGTMSKLVIIDIYYSNVFLIMFFFKFFVLAFNR